jgi:phage baseplate assembly protein W
VTDRLLGFGFPFRIAPGGGVLRAEDFDKLEANLRHLLTSRPGERPMLRTYGGGIHHRLQEPNAAPLRALLRHEIDRSLRTYMPEVRLTAPLTVSADGERLTVTIEYAAHPREVVRRLRLELGSTGPVP